MTTNDLDKMPREEQEKFARLVIDTIISANHTIFKLEQFKFSPAWMRETKNYGNNFLKRLMKIERDFDLLSSQTGDLEDVYDSFHDYMDTVNRVPTENVKQVTNIIRAWKIDPDRMVSTAVDVIKKQLEKQGE